MSSIRLLLLSAITIVVAGSLSSSVTAKDRVNSSPRTICLIKRSEVKASDYAHAIQGPKKVVECVPESAARSTSQVSPYSKAMISMRGIHRMVLPISIGIFLLTLGLWLLIEIENKALTPLSQLSER